MLQADIALACSRNPWCRCAMESSALAQLTDPKNLRALLAAALARTPHAVAAVAVHASGRCAFASASHGVLTTEPAPRIQLGCLAKVLTAELVIAATSQVDELDAPVAPPGSVRSHPRLRSITLRHLLEHAHGLDDSLVERAPLRDDGFIDERALWRALGDTPPIAAPGELYSYGNAGAWLAAAWLERRMRRRYADLVRACISGDAGDVGDAGASSSAGAAASAPICASLGRGLAVSADQLLEFVRARAIDTVRTWPCDARAGACGALRDLPGWNPLERGVHLGWKAHTGGWFGHASTWPGASALIRAHPERRIALVVAGGEHPASLLAARMFGAALPEAFEVRFPARCAPQRNNGGDAHGRAGLYRSAARSVLIQSAGSALTARGVERYASGREVSACATLRETTDGVFFAEPAAFAWLAYVQFLGDDTGSARYLWNGRFVLRKVVR
jgi:CubicO group peptidase (beta-lactamase class C family)